MSTAKPSLRSPTTNRLLAALPAVELAQLEPHLELVHLTLGRAVHESGDSQRYVYFPTNSIVTLMQEMEDGFSAGFAVVGNEGAVGIASFMGGKSTPNRAVVLSAGYAYRLGAGKMGTLFDQSGNLRDLLLRYTQALITQTTQIAVCNRHHSLEQQLCRFLLQCLDRLPFRELVMTQELIANTLGVRREGIAGAAGRLQAEGVIHYRRGHITVLDRRKLEAQACECYAVVKREYERLLPEHGQCGPALENRNTTATEGGSVRLHCYA